MIPRRHVAPSRIRYAAAHPARTVRFNRKADERIRALSRLLDVSYNRAVNIVVDGVDDAALELLQSHAHELGIQEGVKLERAMRASAYAESDTKFWLTLPCPKCGQPIDIRTTRGESVVGILAIPEFWAHGICPSPPNAASAHDG